ncbi:Nramp family divalent metal transporter [Halomarina pelagica]|uniref:Nramp family divalent metal transporter n=1 Tax=Halomarina pelagica TaxID=2961599 RepID=UPI0020C31E46|nr:Nramp family divalent metal transporter [Halomarina sp. BND7]
MTSNPPNRSTEESEESEESDAGDRSDADDADGTTPDGTDRSDGGGGIAASDVYASDAGSEYRGSVYVPVAYDNLETAPDGDEYPDRGTGGRFRLLDLPKVPEVSHVVGPSAIMLGASLGSGETLFWPLLVAQHGWALYWAFFVGVLTQFVVNTEIQRWTLATGESIFRAYDRVHPYWPWFFLVAGFVSLGWPGWAASAAKIGAAGLALGHYRLPGVGVTLVGWRTLGVLLMAFIWLTYQLTPLVYNVVERFQIVLVALAIAFALLLFVVVAPTDELAAIPTAAVGVGTLPPDRDIAVFLGGLAYAGAGGYLNLSQSLWVREKGYGMGRYQGRVKNPLIGDDPEPVQRDGFFFRPTRTNVARWREWWRVARLEHLLTFVLGLLVGATALMAVARAFAAGTDASGVDMWLLQIAPAVGGLGRALIYVVLFLALFTTEFAIVESFVRNSADIVYESYGRTAGWSLPRIFWVLLTVFAGWGVLILVLPVPVEDPFSLLVVGGAMSGLMMWPYIVLTQVINVTRLPEPVRPGWPRVVAMWWAAAFFGYFSVLLVDRTIAATFDTVAFHASVTVVGSAPGGYLLWLAFSLVQGYTVVRTAGHKLRSQGTVDGAAARGRSR